MKRIRICMSGSRWQRTNDDPGGRLHFRGTAFSGGAMHPTLNSVAAMLPQTSCDPDAWGNALAGLSGFFSLVWQSDGYVVAAVDRIRSIPLFYSEHKHAVLISDDAEWIRQEVGDAVMDACARSEFELAGYVTGEQTLYPRVKQLQAGELLIAQDTAEPAAATYRFYRFLHAEPATSNRSALRQRLEAALVASTGRLVEYAGGRQIVLPMGADHDSRLIATLLCKLGYKNMLAFGYGVNGNRDCAAGREAAAALGLKWHYVEYGPEQWQETWNTDERRRYQKWASGWVSLPQVRDWAIVRSLQQDGVLERGCVFVPGHGGDFIAGGHIPDGAFGGAAVSADTLVEKILDGHYRRSTGNLGPRASCATWKERILNRCETNAIRSHVELADAFEKWEWQERQAKFVVNAVRAYDFFGYDWWLPLWDAEFMEFWQTAPLAARRKCHVYREYVMQAFAARTGMPATAHLSAGDMGPLARGIRAVASLFPAELKTHLQSVRQAIPASESPFYTIRPDVPGSEKKRLHTEGYEGDDIQMQDFLKMVS